MTRVHNFEDKETLKTAVVWDAMSCGLAEIINTSEEHMPVFIYVHHNDVWGTGGKVYALSGSAQVEGTQST